MTQELQWEALQAAVKGNLEGLQQILDANPDLFKERNPIGETLLHVAAAGGHLETIKYLSDKGLEINAIANSGASPLFEAVNHGNRKAASLLRTRGARLSLPRSHRFLIIFHLILGTLALIGMIVLIFLKPHRVISILILLGLAAASLHEAIREMRGHPTMSSS